MRETCSDDKTACENERKKTEKERGDVHMQREKQSAAERNGYARVLRHSLVGIHITHHAHVL